MPFHKFYTSELFKCTSNCMHMRNLLVQLCMTTKWRILSPPSFLICSINTLSQYIQLSCDPLILFKKEKKIETTNANTESSLWKFFLKKGEVHQIIKVYMSMGSAEVIKRSFWKVTKTSTSNNYKKQNKLW